MCQQGIYHTFAATEQMKNIMPEVKNIQFDRTEETFTGIRCLMIAKCQDSYQAVLNISKDIPQNLNLTSKSDWEPAPWNAFRVVHPQ